MWQTHQGGKSMSEGHDEEQDLEYQYVLHIHHHHYHCASMMRMPEVVEGAQVSPAQFPLPPACPEGKLHVVSPGETLYGLSRQYDVPLNSIIAANPQIPNPEVISPGQTVCIPIPAGGFPPGTPYPPTACAGRFYTVQARETLYSIAQRFGVTVAAILAANPQIANPNVLQIGQEICVPGVTPICEGGKLYTVVAGGTLSAIARRFGVTVGAILDANPQIVNPDVIIPGQQLCIPSPTPIA
jgi:LysM repeat protein